MFDKVAYKIEWRKKNAERIKAYTRKYDAARRLAADPADLRAKHKAWRDANPDACKAKARRYYAANRERLRADQKARRKANPLVEAAARDRAKAWALANPEQHRANIKRHRETNWPKYLLQGARRSSKTRKHKAPTIDADFLKTLWATQAGLCHWTGIPMTIERDSPWSVSIDRLDNSKGYDADNVQLCCWWANLARNNYTVEEFRNILAAVRAAANS